MFLIVLGFLAIATDVNRNLVLLFCFRCREKQRKEASRLQAVNRKLTAMNKLLMEENDRLQKQVSQLVYENSFFRQHTHNNVPFPLIHSKSSFYLFLFGLGFFINYGSSVEQTTVATTDTSCESVVTSGQHHVTPQHPPRDASPAGLVTNHNSPYAFI